ncbi:MAG TPA: GNAT family N-acetyltransferase [Gaiellaceae bacterium]|nr:GNAT family N-acetyltransferase [Gaiellaceae bacterium]
MGGFPIAVDDPRRGDVRRLLAQHRSFASGVMPPDGVHVLDPDEDASDGNVTLFSVRVDGELLGIGSLRQLNPVHVEVKSMHTAIAARRRGVGRALLEHLVTVAATRGVRRVSLETGAGEAFELARSLYASAGFVPCGPFGEYTATADNVFMTRLLG